MTVVPTESSAPAADVTARVQDDLFLHVNGTWLAKAVIPQDRSMDGAFYRLRDTAEADSKAIVEEAAALAAPVGSPEQLIGDLYRSFMDTETVERLGTAPIGSSSHWSTASVTPRACCGCWVGCSATGSAARSPSTSIPTRPTRIATC